jgi:hypothetical protein
MLQVTRLDHVFSVHNSVEEAIEALKAGSGS